MTLPPHKIGDHGHRYMVETLDYPAPGWQPAGYSATLTGAQQMADAFKLAPGCTSARIIDRQCNHDNSTPLNQGPIYARLYRCDDCGEKWERDVS